MREDGKDETPRDVRILVLAEAGASSLVPRFTVPPGVYSAREAEFRGASFYYSSWFEAPLGHWWLGEHVEDGVPVAPGSGVEDPGGGFAECGLKIGGWPVFFGFLNVLERADGHYLLEEAPWVFPGFFGAHPPEESSHGRLCFPSHLLRYHFAAFFPVT